MKEMVGKCRCVGKRRQWCLKGERIDEIAYEINWKQKKKKHISLNCQRWTKTASKRGTKSTIGQEIVANWTTRTGNECFLNCDGDGNALSDPNWKSRLSKWWNFTQNGWKCSQYGKKATNWPKEREKGWDWRWTGCKSNESVNLEAIKEEKSWTNAEMRARMLQGAHGRREASACVSVCKCTHKHTHGWLSARPNEKSRKGKTLKGKNEKREWKEEMDKTWL